MISFLSQSKNPVSQGSRLDWFLLLIVAGLGLINLPVVFGGDQAFFTLGALEMDQGERLYQDFWDLKQPGIFYFYYLAGKLLGFTNIGIHSFELLALLLFSWQLQTFFRGQFRHGHLASLTPLLTVGFYYCVTGTWHLTQVESLVGMPLFMATMACIRGIQRWHYHAANQAQQSPEHMPRNNSPFRNPWFWAAGVAGGIVLLFKFVLALVLAGIWATLLVWGWLRAPRSRGSTELFAMVQAGLCLSLATAVSLGLGLLPIVQAGAGSIAWETFFGIPPRILSELPQAELSQLFNSMAWFRSHFLPLLVLATWGLFKTLRRGNNPIVLALLAWCLSGFAVLLLQKQAWWDYYYFLLFVPLGLLAAFGLDELDWLWHHQRYPPNLKRRWGQAGAWLCLSLLFVTPLQSLTRKSLWLSQEISDGSQAAISTPIPEHLYRASPEYYLAQMDASLIPSNVLPLEAALTRNSQISNSASSIRPPGAAEQIYVMGNPLIYLLAERGQATALNGWALEFFLPEQWTVLETQLRQAQPQQLFMTSFNEELMAARSPQTLAFITENYKLTSPGKTGNWYSLSPPASGGLTHLP